MHLFLIKFDVGRVVCDLLPLILFIAKFDVLVNDVLACNEVLVVKKSLILDCFGWFVPVLGSERRKVLFLTSTSCVGVLLGFGLTQLARITKSRMFFGLLCPTIICFWWMSRVPVLLPKMSQFDLTVLTKVLSCGWKVVVRIRFSETSVSYLFRWSRVSLFSLLTLRATFSRSS